ncbi:MAG: hypothetical protein K2N80_10075 [Lachnospiraceae bacterium]|nr:hypothetical protein [Lachnospiraceae bacterium]
MLNRKRRGMEAGILLAVTVWTVCQTEEAGRAAVNIASLDACACEMAVQDMLVYDAAQTAVLEARAAAWDDEEAAAREAENEPEGGFHVTYQGDEAERFIELRHCDCVYDTDDIQIYAEYLYWLMVPENFPYNQYVLYIRTPQEELQLYPVRDFLVDEEHGILYTKIAGDDGFFKVQSMSFTGTDGPVLNSMQEIFDMEQAEEMLCSAYHEEMGSGADGGQELFSNITVELTEVCADGAGLSETGAGEDDAGVPGTEAGEDGAGLSETGSGRKDAGILKGEIGGIEKMTGQRYYADWKVDMADGALSVALCVPKQYDSVKDKETFADCDRIFDQIEQGDWSDVKSIEEQYLWGLDAEEWLRMDVNGDGMPELVGGWVIEELPDYVDSRKIEISVIFAYQDGMAEMVYLDVNDGMEFLFITADGELVYEWGVSGGPTTNVFRRCTFDLKWNREYLDTLVRYRFPEILDEDESFAEEREYYREHYPDTYGAGGSGVYCLRDRPKTEDELKHNDDGQYTVRESLTEEEFLKLYEEWTGWDFYKAANVH